MKKKMSYKDKIEKLIELLNEEHCYSCDDFHGCDIKFAQDQGFNLWSITLFSYSGAASNEFNKLYKSLPKLKFNKAAEKERKLMCKESHASCPNCNAVMWHYEDLTDDEGMYCTCCAETVHPSEAC